MQSTTRRPTSLSESETKNLIDFVMSRKKQTLKPLMVELGLTTSGSKPDFRKQIAKGINEKTIDTSRLIQFLNEQAPLSKQHVYLYEGVQNRKIYTDLDHVQSCLDKHGILDLYNSSRSLLLPKELTLSSVRHSNTKLTIYANLGKLYFERDSDLDEFHELEDGSDVEWRAYRQHTERISVIFRWDLVSNNATLHITQLPSRVTYENVRDSFFDLVRPWMGAIDNFKIIDIQKAIKKLHTLHSGNQGETDSHKIGYRTPGGIDVIANSSSANTSLHDNQLVDNTMLNISNGKNVTGRIANIWFLTKKDTPHLAENKLTEKIRVEINGYHKRINIPTPQTEEVINYVLARIRFHSK